MTHPLLTEDLLKIKRPLERERQDHPSILKDDKADLNDDIDSVGSLSISPGGRATFFGQTANSWYLLQNEEGLDEEEERVTHSSPQPTSLPWLDHAFPFASPANKSTENIRGSILPYLPQTLTAAKKICDIYFRHAAWMYTPISENDFLETIFRPMYEQNGIYQGSVSSHSLAVLFLVLSIGTLLDLNMPAHSPQAMHYYQLGRAALALDSVIEEQTIPGIQALELDKKVRQDYVPPSLQVPGFGGRATNNGHETEQPTIQLTMQRYIAFAIKEISLFYMHRGYFAQAMEDSPTDPMGNKYSQSVLAAYTSATTFVGLIESLFKQHPGLTERIDRAYAALPNSQHQRENGTRSPIFGVTSIKTETADELSTLGGMTRLVTRGTPSSPSYSESSPASASQASPPPTTHDGPRFADVASAPTWQHYTPVQQQHQQQHTYVEPSSPYHLEDTVRQTDLSHIYAGQVPGTDFYGYPMFDYHGMNLMTSPTDNSAGQYMQPNLNLVWQNFADQLIYK
ncbi:hypothetical protein H0H81_003602 [Sphagnurus paluster]|uniref:Transcription factor domain-containing protein n=1 Tax=Sphagnurus paluster TaxID=117069 RepID=A0A9P7FV25_9AGAR|nr:hypothetical protein H0H81_003602 [Sphagnurus paluster]